MQTGLIALVAEIDLQRLQSATLDAGKIQLIQSL
jgi:hypothetical protein